MTAPAYSITPKLSQGSGIRLGRGDTPTWTNVTGVQNIEWPDRVPADLDITNQASPGLAEENMPGLLPAIDWSVDLLLDDGSAGDTALTALNARDGTTGEKELHLVEVTAGGKTITCVGYLKDYKPIASLKGVVTMRATWRLMATVANAS